MKRNCNLDEISDGNLYDAEDLVEASCDGCKGQAVCCRGMGGSIILDPYDLYRLTGPLELTFEQLLRDKIELNVVDGIILPNLKMTGPSESCAFLDGDGRCSIHAFRPGICRIFPLGRYYEKHSFHYFLQVNECMHASKTKVKVSNWVDTPELKKYEQYVTDWHYFLNDCEDIIRNSADEKLIKNMNLYLLNCFYVRSYRPDRDFYVQFYERLQEARKLLEQIQ